MKKRYNTPEMEVILLDEVDIITSSNPEGQGDKLGGQDGNVDAIGS